MNEQMLEQQSDEALSLTVEVSDEALEAAGDGNALRGPLTPWCSSPPR